MPFCSHSHPSKLHARRRNLRSYARGVATSREEGQQDYFQLTHCWGVVFVVGRSFATSEHEGTPSNKNGHRTQTLKHPLFENSQSQTTNMGSLENCIYQAYAWIESGRRVPAIGNLKSR